MRAEKKKHPQGVEQFADSHNALADAPKQYQDITLDGQLSLFDAPKLRITKPLRLIELFSGIGAQAKALQRLGVPYESWGAYDIDKYAVAAYNAIHGTDYLPTDIAKMTADDLNIVDTEHYTYLLTYSFPCTDLSLAGKHLGMSKGSGTHSGLLWEVERLLNECEELPQILVMENVKQIVSKKHKVDFDLWRDTLSRLGYESYYKVMNSKDYGVAQSRERCFMVSCLGRYDYQFPEKIRLAKTMRAYLENDPDEQYYLPDEQIASFVRRTEKHRKRGNGFKFEPYVMDSPNAQEVAHTICARDRKEITANYILVKNPGCKCVGTIEGGGYERMYEEIRRVYSPDGVSPTITAKKGGNHEVKISEEEKDFRIRKLTPLECWRLMDFDDDDYIKLKNIESNAQLYAQAGNSIVVNCLVAIFGQMFEGKENVYAERFER